MDKRKRATNPTGEKRRDTKECLKKAGLRLMATKGYHKTKIANIVQEIGATQGTFYWYFSSKMAMTLEVIAEGRETLLAVFKKGYRQSPGGTDDMLGSTEQLILELLEFAVKNKAFMLFLLVRGHGADERIDKAVSETRRAAYKSLRQNISRATELDMLPPHDNLSIRAALLHRLLEGSIAWWLFGDGYDLDHRPRVPAKVLAKEIARFEFFGLLGKK